MIPVLRTKATELAADIAGLDTWMRDVGSRPGAIPDVVSRVKALQAAVAAGPVSVEEAEAIWGRPGRYLLRCDGCGESACAVVTVGEEPDCESRTADLCRPCLVAALAVMDAAGVSHA